MDGVIFLRSSAQCFERARELAEGALAQVGDADFPRVPAPGANSLAVLVRHMSGNLCSRWTDFLTTDGEKPDRQRDHEFEDEGLGRAELMARWDESWDTCLRTLRTLRAGDLLRTVHIREEPWSVLAAIQRSLSHADYHTGQIVQLARHWVGDGWQCLSIPRGQSQAFLETMQARHRDA